MIFFLHCCSEELKAAMMNFAAGKRHMLVQDPNAAVTAFAEACEALGKIYGETANQCGEAYFYYGKALLDLARMEAGVIDNVLDGGNFKDFYFFVSSLQKFQTSHPLTFQNP